MVFFWGGLFGRLGGFWRVFLCLCFSRLGSRCSLFFLCLVLGFIWSFSFRGVWWLRWGFEI